MRLIRRLALGQTLAGEVRLVRDEIARAERFPLHLPVWFRLAGEGEWRQGRTENMSRSGVLFGTDEPVPLLSHVEIGLVLSLRPGAAPEPQVLCGAEIVRTAPVSADGYRETLAARIYEYRFVGEREA